MRVVALLGIPTLVQRAAVGVEMRGASSIGDRLGRAA